MLNVITTKRPLEHVQNQSRKEIVFELEKRRKIQFLELSHSLRVKTFDSLLLIGTPYSLLYPQLIQISCLVTHFCVQAAFKVPLSKTISTQEKVEF